jgi:D-alanyl-D-alanine dipeptidase
LRLRSGHSKGSTLDLTIINTLQRTELDMGSPYDFFGHESWVNYQAISANAEGKQTVITTT